MISKVLTEEQILKIHEASLSILERVGVSVPHKEVLKMFADSGAKVDMDTQRVRIGSDLVKSSLEKAGKQFTVYGRDISKKARFGCGERNYNSTAGQASWVESPGAKRRYTTLQDVKTACKMADALDSITIAGAMSDPHELPVEYRCVEVMAEMLRNTTKPVAFWFHDRASAKYIVEMMIALRGDLDSAARYPLSYPLLEPISPLRFPFNGIDLLFATASLNLPVHIGPMAQLGLSAPGTLAATMALENAEILAGICITQLIRPGMGVCYGGICHAFDMATTQLIFSGPEQAIFGVAMTQMGKHYGLPVYINSGLTDAKIPDAQAGLEAGVTLMLAAAAGADIFGHMGISGVDQASSLDILVMQNEIISYIESVMRQIDFDDDMFGLDIIEQVGPGGTFIDRIHTAEHFRKELWFPRLLDRNYYQAWLDSGAESMEDRCRAMKDQILKTHQPEPLNHHDSRIIDEIVTAARAELIDRKNE